MADEIRNPSSNNKHHPELRTPSKIDTGSINLITRLKLSSMTLIIIIIPVLIVGILTYLIICNHPSVFLVKSDKVDLFEFLKFVVSALQLCVIGVVAISLYRIVRLRYWTRFGELHQFMVKHPYLYDLWYNPETELDARGAKDWIECKDNRQRTITLIFLEMWSDSILEIEPWIIFLGGYNIRLTSPAKEVAKILDLERRAGYDNRAASRLGIQQEIMENNNGQDSESLDRKIQGIMYLIVAVIVISFMIF